ncbi:TPA: hypothetical protein ACW72O_002792 [Elizabethkingia anophelis]|uniref:Uncharacterized protein n=1 Tax=Elizabethkingia ursingii TaxID=1756150 RepID=A0ABX3N8V3_9FLAO|nr:MULTISPECIES: hypothetical protein [Elizabethkingia]AQW94871.1 hypothetical protein BBD30_12150 [Elizabethkingia anophelis]MCL1690566.1 hypothetical protein [Elizabethkingia anophelis]MDV3950836.1 hypothetical protein [Elizabethkingia anophelis]MDV4010132.1 hypothetical protein [Elizabethkingia anophelis]MYY49907.1 hypothetical protein [Elizabethkingia anophelis]
MIKDEQKINERKDYFSPTLEVELIEMRRWISACPVRLDLNQPGEKWQTIEHVGKFKLNTLNKNDKKYI